MSGDVSKVEIEALNRDESCGTVADLAGHVVDENTVEHLDMIKTNFGLISERISHIMASSK